MSEFTPNTDVVRYNYAFFLGVYSECRVAEFDRWLAQHDAEVWARAKREFLDEQLGNVRMQVEAEREGTIGEVPND